MASHINSKRSHKDTFRQPTSNNRVSGSKPKDWFESKGWWPYACCGGFCHAVFYLYQSA